jgi:hypothetical protein
MSEVLSAQQLADMYVVGNSSIKPVEIAQRLREYGDLSVVLTITAYALGELITAKEGLRVIQGVSKKLNRT